MGLGCKPIRFAALASLCALISWSSPAAEGQLLYPPQTAAQPTPDSAQSSQSPLADNYSWGANVVANDPPAPATSAPTPRIAPNPGVQGSGDTPSNSPAIEDTTTLAKRVEALEQTIRQMNAARPAELLPGLNKEPQQSKDEARVGECIPKKIDTINKPTFQPTGRIFFDGVAYDDDDETMAFFDTDRADELGFRTFRIGGKGNIYENLIYNVEFEIRGTNSAIAYKDIYMEQQELPGVGHLRAGHFKEPLSMEDMTSDLYVTNMERTPATQAFSPSRNFGIMVWDTTDECEDGSWFAGVFRADSPDSPTNTGLWRSNNNDWCFDARAVWLPFYDEPSNGRYLVHLGGSYSFRHIGGLTPTATYNQNTAYSTLNGLAEFSTKSWVGSQAPIGFGAEADTNQWNQLDSEFLVIWGSASIQSEYYQLFMNSGEQFNGGYAFLSYFLTGESRAYRKDLKILDRTQPFEPFFWVNSAKGQCCGWGAWELSLGYSWVNLDDGHDTVATVPANSTNRLRGFENAAILGVNWYQNAWSRMYFDFEREMVNFVDANAPDSNANIFGVRWQVDW